MKRRLKTFLIKEILINCVTILAVLAIVVFVMALIKNGAMKKVLYYFLVFIMGVLLSFAIDILGEMMFLAIGGKAITVENIVANTRFYDFNYYIIYFALLIGFDHFWLQHYENISGSKKILSYVVFFTMCSIIPFIA